MQNFKDGAGGNQASKRGEMGLKGEKGVLLKGFAGNQRKRGNRNEPLKPGGGSAFGEGRRKETKKNHTVGRK